MPCDKARSTHRVRLSFEPILRFKYMVTISSNNAAYTRSPAAALDSVSDQEDCSGDCREQNPIATDDPGPSRRHEQGHPTKRKSHSSLSSPGDKSLELQQIADQPIQEFDTLLNDMNTKSAPEIPELVENAAAFSSVESDITNLVLTNDLTANPNHSAAGSPTWQIWQGKTIESILEQLVPTSIQSTLEELTQTGFDSSGPQREFYLGESLTAVTTPLMATQGNEPMVGSLTYPVNSWSGGSSQSNESAALNTMGGFDPEKVQASLMMNESAVTDSVLQQVMETIVTESVSLSGGSSRSLSIQIHPAELGRLEIVIGSNDDVLKAQIVASETVTSDLLTREKSHLINALREQGIDLTDVDISHRDPRDQDQQQFQSAYQTLAERALQNRTTNSNRELGRPQNTHLRSTTLVDVIA